MTVVIHKFIKITAQKIKFFIKDFFTKCKQIRRNLFTEEILNGKFHFFCAVDHELIIKSFLIVGGMKIYGEQTFLLIF